MSSERSKSAAMLNRESVSLTRYHLLHRLDNIRLGKVDGLCTVRSSLVEPFLDTIDREDALSTAIFRPHDR